LFQYTKAKDHVKNFDYSGCMDDIDAKLNRFLLPCGEVDSILQGEFQMKNFRLLRLHGRYRYKTKSISTAMWRSGQHTTRGIPNEKLPTTQAAWTISI
jgi:hypothetical protein